MILALDVGNTRIYGGVFEGDQLKLQFRKSSQRDVTSDEIGLFLRQALRENGIDPAGIREIGACSVVPELVHSFRNACRKYFGLTPFILEAGVKTGLKIKYRNPLEVGADRIANAIAATHLYPARDLIIVDFGTATTFCAVSAAKEYLGGVIAAGMKISMEVLEARTARLPTVEIVVPEAALGRSTVESIQSGLYYGHIGMIREVAGRLAQECFGGRAPLLIGTGGFAGLFARENLFEVEAPDLVLKGIYLALKLNSAVSH